MRNPILFRGCGHLPDDICLPAFSFPHSWVLWWLNIPRLWDLCCLGIKERNGQEIKSWETRCQVLRVSKKQDKRTPESRGESSPLARIWLDACVSYSTCPLLASSIAFLSSFRPTTPMSLWWKISQWHKNINLRQHIQPANSGNIGMVDPKHWEQAVHLKESNFFKNTRVLWNNFANNHHILKIASILTKAKVGQI